LGILDREKLFPGYRYRLADQSKVGCRLSLKLQRAVAIFRQQNRFNHDESGFFSLQNAKDRRTGFRSNFERRFLL